MYFITGTSRSLGAIIIVYKFIQIVLRYLFSKSERYILMSGVRLRLGNVHRQVPIVWVYASLPSTALRSSKAEGVKVIISSFSELNQNLQSEHLEEAI